MNAATLPREPTSLKTNGHQATPVSTGTLSADELRKMNAYWRAANYLSVGQIYLYDNPLLKDPVA